MLDRTSSTPLHIQMEKLMREKMAKREWAPGHSIPSENELSQIYGISRMTVRNVITRLVQEDLFERIPGKGTYVKEPKIIAKSLSYAGVREQLEQMGYEVNTKVLSITNRKVSSKTAQKFSLPPDTDFYVIQRLRYVKGVPLSMHTSYIPASYSPGLEQMDLENEQLCVILSRVYGFKQVKTIETLESVAASKAEAELLDVRIGHPLLLLEDSILTENGIVYEYARVVFRGDKLKVHLEF